MIRTKTDDEMAQDEADHAESDPERAELIARARRFKSSWIELAEALVEVKRSGRFRDWGYEDFDTYAKKELRLRQETVDKLTGSYSFLKRRAPPVLERDGLADEIPSYQAVDFLRRASEREETPRDVVQEIQRRVIDEAVPVGKVAREFGETVFPISVDERKKREAAGLTNVAKRLRELLDETHIVPKKCVVETQAALDRLLEVVREEKVAAA